LVEKLFNDQGSSLLITQEEILKLEHMVSITFSFNFFSRKLLTKKNSDVVSMNLTTNARERLNKCSKRMLIKTLMVAPSNQQYTPWKKVTRSVT